ncbi:hypothetical protein J4457_03140 [Candidatus Woesearchaeota archaeon]|nr:hypothetical protein [Candidatus Woesearchaeota archaeon]
MPSKKVSKFGKYVLLAALAFPAIVTPVVAYVTNPTRIVNKVCERAREQTRKSQGHPSYYYGSPKYDWDIMMTELEELRHPQGLLAHSSEAQRLLGLEVLDSCAWGGYEYRASQVISILEARRLAKPGELEWWVQQARDQCAFQDRQSMGGEEISGGDIVDYFENLTPSTQPATLPAENSLEGRANPK